MRFPSKITIGLTNGSSTFKRPKALTYSNSYVPRSHAADDGGKAMTMHQSAVSPYGVRDPTAAWPGGSPGDWLQRAPLRNSGGWLSADYKMSIVDSINLWTWWNILINVGLGILPWSRTNSPQVWWIRNLFWTKWRKPITGWHHNKLCLGKGTTKKTL
jgi:hypothetical protein